MKKKFSLLLDRKKTIEVEHFPIYSVENELEKDEPSEEQLMDQRRKVLIRFMNSKIYERL